MIEFHPVTKHIGAEVTGVDLRKPLAQEEVDDPEARAGSTTSCCSSATSTSTTTSTSRSRCASARCNCRPAFQTGQRQRDRRARPDPPEGRGRRRVAQRQHVPRRPADGIDPALRPAARASAATPASPACTRRTKRCHRRCRRSSTGSRAVHDITSRCRRRSATATPPSTWRRRSAKCPPVEHSVVARTPRPGARRCS